MSNAVQNCVDALSGTVVNGNNHPGDPYREPARTSQELLATQHLAASARQVDPRANLRQLHDPATVLGSADVEELGIDRLDDTPPTAAGHRRVVAQPPPAKPKSEGWLM